jgi:hypothetical protein
MISINAFNNSGMTEAQLITIRDSAIASIAGGQTVTSVQAPGLTTTFTEFASPVELLRAANHALQLMNPARYGQPIQTTSYGYTR